MIGALLAMSGAIMQGLFRNPLADPALVGVSSGGAFAAGRRDRVHRQPDRRERSLHAERTAAAMPRSRARWSPRWCSIRIASRAGRTSIAIFLLAGLAIAAIANAGIGLLVFIADDRQLRDITFWLLGSLSGATWPKAATLAPVLALGLIAMRVDRARARRAGARRSRGVSQRRRRRAAEADLDRAGVGDDRRCGIGLRRGRLCRHRGAASAAARRSGRRTGCCCRPPPCSARS